MQEKQNKEEGKWPKVISEEKNDILRFEYKLAFRLREMLKLDESEDKKIKAYKDE